MCGYFCIGLINFILKGKSVLDYINLFSLKEYERNERNNSKMFSIIQKLFLLIEFKKFYHTKYKKYKYLKSLKYHIFVIKHFLYLVFLTSVKVEMKKYLRKKN